MASIKRRHDVSASLALQSAPSNLSPCKTILLLNLSNICRCVFQKMEDAVPNICCGVALLAFYLLWDFTLVWMERFSHFLAFESQQLGHGPHWPRKKAKFYRGDSESKCLKRASLVACYWEVGEKIYAKMAKSPELYWEYPTEHNLRQLTFKNASTCWFEIMMTRFFTICECLVW